MVLSPIDARSLPFFDSHEHALLFPGLFRELLNCLLGQYSVDSMTENFSSSTQCPILQCLEQISLQQQRTLEKLDTLITVVGGPPELIPQQLLRQQTAFNPLVNQPEQVEYITSSPATKDDEIFCLRQKATSAKNFSVLLVRHFFQPHELMGRNV